MKEEKKRSNPKRLLIEIPEELHAEIKTRAARRFIPIRLWVSRVLIEAIKKEKEYEKE